VERVTAIERHVRAYTGGPSLRAPSPTDRALAQRNFRCSVVRSFWLWNAAFRHDLATCTYVRAGSSARGRKFTNTCSAQATECRSKKAPGAPFPWPARSCCSRTTMFATGRSQGTSPAGGMGRSAGKPNEQERAWDGSGGQTKGATRARRASGRLKHVLMRALRGWGAKGLSRNGSGGQDSPRRRLTFASPPFRRPPMAHAAVARPHVRTRRGASMGTDVRPSHGSCGIATGSRAGSTHRPLVAAGCANKTGGVLLSQALASQVPSALRGLTALFGMGRGVSPSQ
jgi:hypothetical protein